MESCGLGSWMFVLHATIVLYSVFLAVPSNVDNTARASILIVVSGLLYLLRRTFFKDEGKSGASKSNHEDAGLEQPTVRKPSAENGPDVPEPSAETGPKTAPEPLE